MFQSSMVRTLIAACIVPLVAIGGPGTPMGMALAAIGEAQVVAGLRTFESRSESTGVSRFSQDADGVSPFGTSALHHPDGIASVVRPDRVLAIESGDTDASQGQAAGARLVDGDAATTLRPERGGAVRVVVHFRRPLWLDGVSLWGDAMGELRLLGATSEIPISEVEGGRSPAGDSSKLRRFVLERPLWGQTFYFEWVPGSLELPSEWTFWQRGSAAELSLGEDAEQLFARGALPGASEYWAAAHETQVSVAALYGQRVRSNDSGAAGAGSAEAQVHVTDLAGKGRAFLVYELEGAPHFTAIRRSINGRAALGGARASGEGAGGLQVEEIPLASLVEGDNTVAFFPANPHVTAGYTVRNLRIVTTPRSGALTTLSFEGQGEMASFRRRAEARFAGPSVLDELAVELGAKSQGILSLRAAGRKPLEIDLGRLGVGLHTLKAPQGLGAFDRIEARLDARVAPGSVRRVVLSSLGLSGPASADVVVSYPHNGECFDGEANLRGFVRGLAHPKVTMGGSHVEVHSDGSFEGVRAEPGDGSWHIDIQATDANGRTVTKSHVMQPCLAALRTSERPGQPVDDVGAPFAQVITPRGGVVEFAGARLEIPEGALAEPTRITIRPLPAPAVTAMNPGMKNVTPLGQAYRFGPSGTKFEGPIRVTLPYDEGALEGAASAHHVVGFYYDEPSARWNHVARAGEASGGKHTSFTDHFTDFVNATIATPDASGVATYTPTSMSEAALASALAGVASIAPPGASPWGHASVHYPFELPAGRAGMTPALGLNYSSEQKEGFVGYGWDLGISKIELDTRWGVPDYDGVFTQSVPGAAAGKVVYALDGEPLTSAGSGGGGELFRRRVEGAFQHIVQLGATDQEGAKYFVVTAQDGTKYTYGKTAASRVHDPDTPSHVFRWHLEEVVDVFGNGIQYTYQRVGNSLDGSACTFPGSNPTCAWELVPARIEYTTHTSAPTSSTYLLSFEYRQDDRVDSTVSGRPGFLVSNRSLLQSLTLSYKQATQETLVRKWTFEHEEGSFGKTLLKYVRQKGSNGAEFYSHTFGYSKPDTRLSGLTGDFGNWRAPYVDAFSPEMILASNANPHYSLSQRTGWAFSLQASVGLALFDPRILGISAGVSTNVGETGAQHSFLDISGDGLPDYLNTSGYAQLGRFDYAGSGLLSPAPYLGVDYDMNDVAKDSLLGMTIAGGVGASVSAGAGGSSVSAEGNISTSMDFRTLADMDGDGFLDRVEVYFGQIRVYRNLGSGTDPQRFALESGVPYQSWGDFSPLGELTADPNAVAVPGPDIQSDPVIRWVAPHVGRVTVAGEVRRTGEGQFGVRATIYSQAGQAWTQTLGNTNTNSCVPSTSNGCGGPPLIVDVQPGDSLYFRVHPLSGQIASDPVLWKPTIVYDGATAEVEPYGRPIDRFSLVDDFRLGSGLSMPISVPLTGEAVLGGTLNKLDTSDSLLARVWKVTLDENQQQTRCVLKEWSVPAVGSLMNLTVSTQALASAQGTCPPLENGVLEAGTLLDFELSSDTVVDPERISWQPFVKYTSATVPSPTPGAALVTGSVSCTTGTAGQTCSIDDGATSVPVPPRVAERQAPVSFTPPNLMPVQRTRTITATASSIHLGGYLRRFAMPARVVGLCQSENQLLWKAEIAGNYLPLSEVELAVDEEITGLVPGQIISCSLRSEEVPQGRLELGATNASLTGGLPPGGVLPVPINVLTEDPDYAESHDVEVREWRSLSGGYHGWSFGDFRSDTALFQPDLFQDANQVQQNLQQETPTFFPASPGSVLVDGVPKSAWQIRGGGSMSADGVLHPGVVSPEKALDAGQHGDGALAARISHSFTYGANASSPWVGVGFGGSHYVLDRDLIDMNGDNLPDTVTAFNVGYNTGCLPVGNPNCSGQFVTGATEPARQAAAAMGSTSTETVTTIAKTRLGVEVVRAGGKVNLVRPSRDGVPQAFSSLGVGLGTDFGWTSTKRQLIDMNGDGLPDYVHWNGATKETLVGLNLGYKRMGDVVWPRDAGTQQIPSGVNVLASELSYGVDGFQAHESGIAAVLRTDDFEAGDAGGGDPGDDGLEVSGPSDRATDDGALAHSAVSTVTPSIGGSLDLGVIGASVGVAYQHSVRRDLGRLVDVTGDGLVDYVFTSERLDTADERDAAWLRFRPNLGTGFGPPQILEVPAWSSNPGLEGFLSELHVDTGGALDSIGLSTSSDWTAFEELHICFIFVCAGVSSTQASIDSREQIALQDADGDGLPDFVLKSKDSPSTRAKLNKLGGINLLTSVEGPSGSKTTIHYGRQGATHEHPGVHYAVRSVTVEEPQSNPYVVHYEHGRSGRYDRTERAFLGYAQVHETRPQVSQVETIYANTDYYQKGLPLSRTVYSDGIAGGPIKYVSEAWLYEPPVEADPPIDPPLTKSHFPYEKTRTKTIFEGEATGLTSTETRTWDMTHGNLKTLTIEGDELAKNVTYTITYATPASNVVRASRVTAVGGGVTYRDRRATYGNKGELITVANYNTTGSTVLAQWSIDARDSWGNPTQVTDPNLAVITYTYDPDFRARVETATDDYGLSSTTTYDPSFGKPQTVTDANGHLTSYDYDQFGRLVSITGPKDQGTPVPTVLFEYALPRTDVIDWSNPLWAKTRRKDAARNPSNSTPENHDFIETVQFVDGLGRVIETKKDHLRDSGTSLEVGMTVSGRIVYDSAGRPLWIGQPIFSTEPATTFVFQDTPLNRTTIQHDALDRPTSISVPWDEAVAGGAATTTIEYGLHQAQSGVLKHGTTVTEDYGPPGARTITLRDSDGEVAEVQQFNQLAGQQGLSMLVTSYVTNPMNELTRVTDAKGNVTSALYDALGRTREMTSPDAGRTVFTYYPNGQVKTKETAQLRAKGQKINYVYDRNRLIVIDYPDPATDVTFTYGTLMEQSHTLANIAGRVKSEVSEAGSRVFAYDELGNVATENKTFSHKVDTTKPDYTYTVRYKHDSFGRLLETRFPGADKEVVSYAYDQGGNLQSVYGQKLGFTPAQLNEPPHSTYLTHRGYDEFGKVTREISGNLTRTRNYYQEKSHRLAVRETTFQDDAHRSDPSPRTLEYTFYQYNGHGDLVAINKAAGPHDSGASVGVTPVLYNFEYDYLHQLTHATGESPSSTTQRSRFVLDQQYDEIGNIMLKDQSSFSETQNQSGAWVSTTVPGQTYRNTYTYGGTQPHAPSRIATQGGLTIDYQYDASGNHTQRTSVAGTRNATWTDDDKLRSMKRAADSYDLIRNYYDGQGNKAIAVHPGATSTEEVAFHRGDLTIRVNGDNQYVTKHIYAGGERLASKMDAAWFSERPIQYYVSDHLGSAHYTLDGHQNLLSHTEFFPSGELWIDQLNQNYTQTPRWSFTGKEWDADTGLYDFGARQYDPRVGQWLSPDPILASYMQGGPNGGVYYPINLGLYSYVANNPVKYVDGNGEFFWAPLAICAAVGFVAGYGIASLNPESSIKSRLLAGSVGAFTGVLAGIPGAFGLGLTAAESFAYATAFVAPAGWAASAATHPEMWGMSNSEFATSLGTAMLTGGVANRLGAPLQKAVGDQVWRNAFANSKPDPVNAFLGATAAERGTAALMGGGVRGVAQGIAAGFSANEAANAAGTGAPVSGTGSSEAAPAVPASGSGRSTPRPSGPGVGGMNPTLKEYFKGTDALSKQ